jgi:hypothetical protein
MNSLMRGEISGAPIGHYTMNFRRFNALLDRESPSSIYLDMKPNNAYIKQLDYR